MKNIVRITITVDELSTVEPPNSLTPNSHTYQNSHTYLNSHTLFGFTKMWLFWYTKDINRIKSLIFELFFEFCQKVQSNFVLRNMRIFFWMIYNLDFLVDGEPNSIFLYWHHFLCLQKFRKLRKQFFDQKIIFQIINKNRFLILEENSHIYPNCDRFLVSRNCYHFEALHFEWLS